MVAVVVPAAAFDGEADSMVRDTTIRDVSGDRRGALVRVGSANRLTAEGRGFRDGERPLELALSPIRPTALGVGVTGGGAALACARRFCGVEGAGANAASPAPGTGDSASIFRLRDCTRGAGGGMGLAAFAFPANAPRRADLLVAMAAMLVGERGNQGCYTET